MKKPVATIERNQETEMENTTDGFGNIETMVIAYQWWEHGRGKGLFEIWLFRVSAARPLDNNIRCITAGFHTVFNGFSLNQSRKKSSNKCVTCNNKN